MTGPLKALLPDVWCPEGVHFCNTVTLYGENCHYRTSSQETVAQVSEG